MEIAIVVSNFTYAILGASLTIIFMVFGYKVLDWITPFDTTTATHKMVDRPFCFW